MSEWSHQRTLDRLATSPFRARFRLGERERAMVLRAGLVTIGRHARELLSGRVAPAAPPNDGRQTPMRGHPVFVAQHATATCCRGCISKWHRIPEGAPLAPAQVDLLSAVVMAWIRRDPLCAGARDDPEQGVLL